ncbi:hypothetical protein [Chryseobacterium sp. FH1]|uniref:hypothetical protein n=1 Tax=Chryseobacterium sp. FH1 TaxID=1233951 RepID=UPI000691AE44|nr:hypothetical protein [Chryseobacterium sp. FH1]
MKKITISIFVLAFFSLKAQNINFTNLYGHGASEPENYHLSNVNTGFGGDWGLDVKWWGGVKLRSALGLLYITRDGNVGIGKEPNLAKLDVDGNITSTGNITGSDLISGGSNNWIFHTPDDGRKTLHIAPISSNGYDFTKETTFSDGNVAVRGKLEAKEVKVTQSPTADFVFEEDYPLSSLESVEQYVKEKKHLPEIASAKEMEKEGVNIGEFQIQLLQKIEELTLYSIEQNKQIKIQAEKIKTLELENQQVKTLMERIEKLEDSSRN